MTPDASRSPAQRASRGNQLAAAFLLAFLRDDSLALASLLEDLDGDVMPFAVGLASHAKVLAEQLDGLDVWQRYLTVTAATSADLALDPDAAGRIKRGEIRRARPGGSRFVTDSPEPEQRATTGARPGCARAPSVGPSAGGRGSSRSSG